MGAGPCILWHGLNPSRADAEVDDPTILREIGFSFRWGFGSLVKTNFYPFVTPDPKKLRRWIKDGEGFNEARLINALKVKDEIARAQVRVAAWGAGIDRDAVQEFMGFSFWNVPEIPPGSASARTPMAPRATPCPGARTASPIPPSSWTGRSNWRRVMGENSKIEWQGTN